MQRRRGGGGNPARQDGRERTRTTPLLATGSLARHEGGHMIDYMLEHICSYAGRLASPGKVV
jgi:hypothetical protein